MSTAEQLKTRYADEIKGIMGTGRPVQAAHSAAPGHQNKAAQFEGLKMVRSVKEIPLAKIYTDKQPRESFEDLEGLAASIKRFGQLGAILVAPWSEERQGYRLIAGERRYRACQLAELPTIRAEIWDGKEELTEATIRGQQVVENIQRADLSIVEEGNAYDDLMGLHNFGVSTLAEYLGVSKARVSKALQVVKKLPKEVQDAVTRGEITASNAYELTKVEEPEAREEILTEVKTNRLTQKETASRVRKKKQAPAPKGKKPSAAKLPQKFRSSAGIVFEMQTKKKHSAADLTQAARELLDWLEKKTVSGGNDRQNEAA